MLYRDCPTVEVVLRIEATPEDAWVVVSDIDTSARHSPELYAAEWVGEPGVALGHVFRGSNRNEMLGEWTTTCEVVEVVEGRRWVWEVENSAGPPGSTWAFEVEPTSTGVLVRHWARMGPGPSGLTGAIERMPDKEARIVAGRLEQWREGMSATLAGIRAQLSTGGQ